MFNRGRPKVECHLCCKIINRRDWYDANHREICAIRFKNLISSFPKLNAKSCPMCNGPLSLWPKRGPNIFICTETLTE